MPGRHWTADSSDQYRFGFQGQEKDNKVKGHGNSYNFGKRIYSPRTGQWLSLDPKMDSFPSWSPYNGMKDNPLYMKDEEGGSPSAATYLLINATRSGAVSASTEIATQVATNTLNNVAKQVKQGKEVDVGAAFKNAYNNIDYSDVATSATIGFLSGGLAKGATLSNKVSRVNDAFNKVRGTLENVGKEGITEEFKLNEDFKSDIVGAQAMDQLFKGMKPETSGEEAIKGMIKGFAAEQLQAVGRQIGIGGNENEGSFDVNPENVPRKSSTATPGYEPKKPIIDE